MFDYGILYLKILIFFDDMSVCALAAKRLNTRFCGLLRFVRPAPALCVRGTSVRAGPTGYGKVTTVSGGQVRVAVGFAHD